MPKYRVNTIREQPVFFEYEVVAKNEKEAKEKVMCGEVKPSEWIEADYIDEKVKEIEQIG